MDDRERFRVVAEAFERVRDSDAAVEEARLVELCRGDRSLVDELRTLLAHHASTGDLLDRGAVRRGVGSSLGGSGGRYRVIEVLGEGGMGTVYRAEQESPIRREVAIKVLKLGMDTRQVVRRFEAERQTLARMEHPGIARVFDGGSTPDGRPYFAMELVRGEILTEYCDARRLDVEARIALFVQVCAAVQHAHTKGIIHRDLKPSNILVAELDGRAHPKVIDFGIAKAIGDAGADAAATRATRVGDAIGTPDYMSPEQANGEDVDARSDVFALGVILFELLVGTTPLRVATESRRRTGSRVRGQAAPPRPSSLVDERRTALREAAATAARARRTDAGTLRRLLRRDLDWIVLRALESEPARRYETVAALADDLERRRRSEPVVARPPSTAYLLRTFARRHTRALAAATAVAISLVVGLGVALYGLEVARTERDDAIEARESERRIADRLRAELFASDVERGRQSAARGHMAEFRDLLYSRYLADPTSPHALWALRESEILHPRAWVHDLGATGRFARFTPDERAIVACALGGRPMLLDAESGEPLASARGPWIEANAGDVDPRGGGCVIGDADGGLWIWRFEDAEPRERLRIASGNVFAAWTKDGSIVAGGADGILRRCDAAPDAPVEVLWSGGAAITSLAEGPDGLLAAGFADGSVLLLGRDGSPRPFQALARSVSGLAFDRRGERIACAGADRSIRLHAVEDGRALQRYDPGVGASRSIRFDGDDHLLVLGWWDLSRLDLATGERTRLLAEIGWSFDRAADGRLVLAPGRLMGLGLWHPAEPAMALRRGGEAWSPRAIGADGGFVGVGEGIGVLDAAGRILSTLPRRAGRRLALSRDRRLAAVVDVDLELAVVDLATGSLLAAPGRVAAGEPRTLAFDADGRRLAFVRPDWSIATLDLASGGDEEDACRELDPFEREPLALAFAPEADRLAVCVREGRLHIVDRDDGSRIDLALGTSPFAVLFSPDGRTLAVGTWRGDLFLVEAATGQYRILRGHSAMVNILEQHPTDPEVFLSAGSDGQLRCWHWTLERNLLTLEPFGGRVAIRTAGFAPGGDAILAASVEGDLVRIDLDAADRRIERSLDFERVRLESAAQGLVP